ncbi:hypothetical protein [Streptomyces filamentosus]|uniref:hypothetical protein n=1 Tax=Streptomyces filamentosus TaxID=67294 RepID=UPI0033CDCED8
MDENAFWQLVEACGPSGPDRAYEHLTGDAWDRGTRHSYESYSRRAGRAPEA